MVARGTSSGDSKHLPPVQAMTGILPEEVLLRMGNWSKDCD